MASKRFDGLRGAWFRTTCRIQGGDIQFRGKGSATDNLSLSARGVSPEGMDIVAECARRLIGDDVPEVYAAARKEAGI